MVIATAHWFGGDTSPAGRVRNYNICRAIDLTSLSIELQSMVEDGMPQEQANSFHLAADALLQLIRTENYRLDHFPNGASPRSFGVSQDAK